MKVRVVCGARTETTKAVRTWSYLGMLLFTISGCAGSMGSVRPGPSVPAAQAATIIVTPPVTSFDGTYSNTLRLTSSFGSGKDTYGWCDSPGQPIITVANGQFSYAVPHPNIPGEATPRFPATVKEDGTFYGEIVAGTLSGSIRGSRIEGRIDGSACLYAFTGGRV